MRNSAACDGRTVSYGWSGRSSQKPRPGLLGRDPPQAGEVQTVQNDVPANPVVSKNTNELKTGAPGRFDRHRPVASPRSGACRRRCQRFGFPVRAGRTPSSNGMPRSRAETWTQARDAPGPERASPLRHGSPGLDSGSLGWPLFGGRTALPAAHFPLWRKRGTRKSRLETKTENEAFSAILARLW